jgi:transcriptional regulator with XRE-family HTH domain
VNKLDIKDRIKQIRMALSLSQAEFAEKMGIGQAAVSAIENGIRNVTDRNITLICEKFNVNDEWLRSGNGEMFKTEGELLELLGSRLDDLDEYDKKIITEYIKLSPELRKLFRELIKKMVT